MAVAGGGVNYSEWVNEDYDKLLKEAASGISDEEHWEKLLERES